MVRFPLCQYNELIQRKKFDMKKLFLSKKVVFSYFQNLQISTSFSSSNVFKYPSLDAYSRGALIREGRLFESVRLMEHLRL